jgi:hypothetical protein
VQLDDEPEVEIFSKSETEFFWKGGEDFIPITFVKDKVTKAIQHQYGQTIDAPKIQCPGGAFDPA